MRIKVIHNYGGVLTNEQRIVPGVYDSNDPCLHGARATAHMLTTGHAVTVDDDTPLTAIDDALVEHEPSLVLSDLTNAELKALLDEAGIPYGTRDNKDTLLALLGYDS